MNTNTGHPLNRPGEPRILYIASMAARLVSMLLLLGSCIVLYFDNVDLAMLCIGAGILLYLGGGTLRNRAWWHLSLEEQQNAREPLWASITMEAGFVLAFTALPLGMILTGNLIGIVAAFLVLYGGAGYMSATAIIRRKKDTPADRTIRAIRAAALTALAVGTLAWLFFGYTQESLANRVNVFLWTIPVLLLPYGGVLVATLLHSQSKKRQTPTPAP